MREWSCLDRSASLQGGLYRQCRNGQIGEADNVRDWAAASRNYLRRQIRNGMPRHDLDS